ncbi:MAG TPA: flagellar basal body L-ring protein FlgH [Bacteroidetes bacterium]|nr:flagellar basal body L-ring protein FlgH [Bacteroidota bacterium]HEX04996.1 flagellar basal body L-ring protein FlgH [Bacteroidota bacterium]
MSRLLITGIIVLIVLIAAIIAPAQTINNVVARSLYSDQKAIGEGDIITVLIVEFTRGANQTDTRTNADNRTIVDVRSSGTFNDLLPSLGLDNDLSNRSTSSGKTESRNSLESRMTAVVTEVQENGMLVIQGTRTLEVNGETQTTTVTGIVRAEDVGSDNTVFSYNIANATISYTGDGMVNDAGKPGFLTRMWNWFF